MHKHAYTLHVHTHHIHVPTIVCAHVCIVQLALKHRQNKNQKMRIVAFIGSPMEAEEKEVRHIVYTCDLITILIQGTVVPGPKPTPVFYTLY